MRKHTGQITRLLAIVLLVALCAAAQPLVSLAGFGKPQPPMSYADRAKVEILVKFKNEEKAESVKSLAKGKLGLAKLETKQRFSQRKMDVLEVDKTADIAAVIDELRKNPDVEYAQPNYRLSVSSLPADPMFPQQWGLSNTGQEVEGVTGRVGVDINASPAWDLTTGSGSVIVGVLDTGVDTSHPDLLASIFVNTDEVPGDGLDNDGNGYVDDVNGWDFANADNTVFDGAESDTHGTKTAGIIAATSNTQGITGVAPNVKVLPLKFISGDSGYTSDAIEAINYAVAMGVKLMNCSFSGYDDNPALKDAMESSGILFVVAAGNRGGDIAQYPVYPTAFDIPNMLSVASIESDGSLAAYSTFGQAVDVAAPGENILSTAPANTYGYLSGTSASAALTTGVVALSKSYLPNLSYSDIAQRVKDNVVVCAALDGKLGTEGRINAYAALTGARPPVDGWIDPNAGEPVPPLDPSDLDSWFTADQLAKIRETLHYGESGINPATGNFSVTANDISVPAPGFQVNISRTYNSKNDKVGPLGRGWTFGFESYMEGADLVTVHLPSGGIQMFKKNGSAFAPLDSRSTFVKNADNTYILTTKDQYSYGFRTDGKLSWMKDRNGNQVTVNYGGSGKISTIVDTVGRTYTLYYNAQHTTLIDHIVGPEGINVYYGYDSSKRLTTVTDPEGGIMRYSYDGSNYLNRIANHSNETLVSLVYDHSAGANQHKVKEATDAFGCVNSYTYGDGRTTILEGGTRQWTYWFDESNYTTQVQDPEGKSAFTEYYLYGGKNLYGDVKSTTDRNGNTTNYEVDARGNVTRITNPDTGFRQYWYDEKNNLVKETDECGYSTFYVYDSAKVNLLKKVQPLIKTGQYVEGTSNPSDFAITQYQYCTKAEAQSLFGCNVAGLVKAMQDPEGHVTTYTYDPHGNTATVKDPLQKTTTYDYDAAGRRTSILTPKGYLARYEYDDNGLVVKEILHGGETTRTVYDEMGRKVQVVEPKQYVPGLDAGGTYTGASHGYRYSYFPHGKTRTVTDPEGYTTTYAYDVFGNRTSETKHNGSVYEYEYDCLNRVTKEYFRENAFSPRVLLKEHSYAIVAIGGGQPSKTQKTDIIYFSDTESAATVCIYDYAGRLLEQHDPDGAVTRTSYNLNGTVHMVTRPNGSTVTLKYDDLGRLGEQWTPLEVSGSATMYSYTRTEYDKAGRKRFEYRGRTEALLDEVPASFVTKSWTYDGNGKVLSVTDNEGRKTEYQYDADGNLARQDVYTNALDKITTEYVFNHLGKQVEKKQHVRAGDIYANSFEDSQDLVLTTISTYDKNGNLETVTTPDGVTTTYVYDYLNRQTSVSMPGQDEYGNPTTITASTTYDWQGKPLTRTDANGNVTTYAYDRRGFLSTVTNVVDSEPCTTAYWCDRAGRKIAEVSAENYDSLKVLSEMDRTEYLYDDMGRLKAKIMKFRGKTVDPGTMQWVETWTELVAKAFKYDTSGNLIKELTGRGYDAGTGSTVDERINSGYGTEYTYNLANQLVTVRDAVSRDRALAYTVKYEYDALGRKTSETNAKGAITGYQHDDAGNVVFVTVRKTSSSPEQTVAGSTYDFAGRQTSSTDGNGNMVVYQYNAFGNLRQAAYPGDASIPTNTVTYQYDVLGNLKKQKDTLGKIDLYDYDNQGRVLSHMQRNESGTQVITTSTMYDKNGNKRFETDGNGTTVENKYDELNRLDDTRMTVGTVLRVTDFDYDKMGNLTTTTDWRGNTFTNVYDAMGRLVEKQDPYTSIQKLEYDKDSAQVKSYDALGNLTQFTYDKNGRLLSTIDPLNNETSQTYDNAGNVETKTDGNGHTTTFAYDEFNRLKTVTNAKAEVTTYTYDLCGNMLTQIDGNGNVTTYEYNARNLPIRKINHGGRGGAPGTYIYVDGLVESYTYYADGNLHTKTDRNGKTAVYTYDVHGRLLSQAIGSDAISYTYDDNGNQLTMSDSTGTTTRTYDEENRVLTKLTPQIGLSTFVYDITVGIMEGETAETSTDPKGNLTTRIYDRAGRLRQVIADGQATTYVYYPDGRRQSVLYPNGAREDYTYYANGLLHTLTNSNVGAVVMDTYIYTYDGAGNQLTKSDSRGVTTYTYDLLNRLETVTEPGGKVTSYTFDRAGNRLTESVTEGGATVTTTYTYDRQNRLTSTVTENGQTSEKTVYAYDGNGNTVSKSKRTTRPAGLHAQEEISLHRVGASANSDVTLYQYNVWNQLIMSQEGDKAVSYRYSGEGLRVEKTVNGVVTRYLYEGDRVVLEVDASLNEIARNTQGLNVLAREVDGTTAYYMYNGHADVTALIDASGTVLAMYYYDAFGNLLEQTGSIQNPFRYAGYFHDGETGLYCLNARYYDSRIARFLTEDTFRGSIVDPLSLNLYAYCLNNPVRYLDPTGHSATEWDKQNCTPEEVAYLDALGVAWETADQEGRAALHAEAERIRNQYRKENEIGSADGHTYVVDDDGNAHLNEYDQAHYSGGGSGGSSRDHDDDDDEPAYVPPMLSTARAIIDANQAAIPPAVPVPMQRKGTHSVASPLREADYAQFKNRPDVLSAIEYLTGKWDAVTTEAEKHRLWLEAERIRISARRGEQYNDRTDSILAMLRSNVSDLYEVSTVSMPSLAKGPMMVMDWYSFVQPFGKWDYKRTFAKELAWFPETGVCTFDGKFITAEELGNINYGYTGIAAGFGPKTLFTGGGWAAEREGTAGIDRGGPYYGDSMHDHFAIQWGIDLYYQQNPSPSVLINIDVRQILNILFGDD
ncbi:MAG: S8 family serine peptidase [Bacillota bacterium]